jgi:hypothetical protein
MKFIYDACSIVILKPTKGLGPSSIFSDALKLDEMKKMSLPYKLPILGRTVHVEVEVEVEVGSPYATELIFKFEKFKTP